MVSALAMLNQVGVAALFAVILAPLLLGVAGESSPAGVGPNVPMITLNEQHLYSYSYRPRPRERRLATAFVWCIAKSNVSNVDLQSSLDWVCGPLPNQGQVNCGPVLEGGACYDPNTLYHHSSWAFNAYFQRMNATDSACDFQGAAMKVTTDPSTGTCVFPGSNVTVNGTLTPSANSPGNAPGSLGSPSGGVTTAVFEPKYLLGASTGAVLITYFFT